MTNHAIENATSKFQSIGAFWELADALRNHRNDSEMLAELSGDALEILGDHCGIYSISDITDETADEVEDAARGLVLAVEVRSGWCVVGSEALEPEEFQIILSTGGPACRITGEIRDGEPCRSEIQWQDWETPWIRLAGQQCDALDWFAGLFYFGS